MIMARIKGPRTNEDPAALQSQTAVTLTFQVSNYCRAAWVAGQMYVIGYVHDVCQDVYIVQSAENPCRPSLY